MEDFLFQLQFDPQIPFGHLLVTTAWLLVTLGVLLFVLRSIRTRGLTTPRTGIGIIALLLSAPVLYANLTIPDAVDFNPGFAAADLVGRWKTAESEIQLRGNGTANIQLEPEFLIRTGLENGEATWKKASSFNITVSNLPPRSGKTLLRVIHHRRELRIIVEDTEASQLWDGDLGFRRQ